MSCKVQNDSDNDSGCWNRHAPHFLADKCPPGLASCRLALQSAAGSSASLHLYFFFFLLSRFLTPASAPPAASPACAAACPPAACLEEGPAPASCGGATGAIILLTAQEHTKSLVGYSGLAWFPRCKPLFSVVQHAAPIAWC